MKQVYQALGVVQPPHFWMLILLIGAVIVGVGLVLRAMIQTLREERLFGILVMFVLIYPVPVGFLLVLCMESIPKEYLRAFGLDT